LNCNANSIKPEIHFNTLKYTALFKIYYSCQVRTNEAEGLERPELIMRNHSKYRLISMLLVMFMIFVLTTPMQVMAAQPTVNLGTTGRFAMLAGSTITNIRTSTITGSLDETTVVVLILLIAAGLLAYVWMRIRSRKMKNTKNAKNMDKKG